MRTTEQLWGTWWRAGDPSRKVDGLLHLAEGEFPRLELNNERNGALVWVGEETSCTLHGDVGGRAVSLFQVRVQSQNRINVSGSTVGQSTLLAFGGALVPDRAGAHVEDVDEEAFSGALVGIDNLSFWDGRTQVSNSLPPANLPAGSVQTFTFEVVLQPERSAEFEEVTVSTRSRWELPAAGGEYRDNDIGIAATFGTAFALDVQHLVSVGRLREVARRLSDLVTVAMNRDSPVRGRTMLRLQGEWCELWLKPARSLAQETSVLSLRDQHDALFRLSDMADFDQLMSSWAALIAGAPYGVDSVVALWRESSTFYENKLIAVCSALEALDCGLHGDHGLGRDPYYKERCEKLIAIPDPDAVRMLVGDTNKWASDMKKARNDLAHGYPPDKRKTPADVWYLLKDRCRSVLALVLMAKLGLPAEIQQQAVKVGGLCHFKVD